MSFRTSILAAVEAARSISGPSGLDIRTHQLTIRKRTWSGGAIDVGTPTDEDLVLPPHYPVRLVKASEVNSAAGNYEVGDVIVRHITPSDGAGTGYTPLQLKPRITAHGQEVIYVLTGPHGGEYGLVEIRTHRPFSYDLVLRRSLRTP